ncbi:hypothetical protein MR657_10505 [bacterium]|nr:hypothetical protein [bacterium]
MTDEELHALLAATGLPVAYDHFNSTAPLPHIAWLETGSHNFAADGVVYYPVRSIRVELYTEYMEPETNALVEDALSAFVWERDQEWLQQEGCYLTTYEFEV